MNAEQAYKEIALSVYELAEAERLDRKAKALRLKSAKRLSVLGGYFKEGIEQVKQGQNAKTEDDSSPSCGKCLHFKRSKRTAKGGRCGHGSGMMSVQETFKCQFFKANTKD